MLYRSCKEIESQRDCSALFQLTPGDCPSQTSGAKDKLITEKSRAPATTKQSAESWRDKHIQCITMLHTHIPLYTQYISIDITISTNLCNISRIQMNAQSRGLLQLMWIDSYLQGRVNSSLKKQIHFRVREKSANMQK